MTEDVKTNSCTGVPIASAVGMYGGFKYRTNVTNPNPSSLGIPVGKISCETMMLNVIDGAAARVNLAFKSA
jgi:hypothetical protein